MVLVLGLDNVVILCLTVYDTTTGNLYPVGLKTVTLLDVMPKVRQYPTVSYFDISVSL